MRSLRSNLSPRIHTIDGFSVRRSCRKCELGPASQAHFLSAGKQRKRLADDRDNGCGGVDVLGDGRYLVLDGFERSIDSGDLGLELDKYLCVVGQALLVEGCNNLADGLLGSIDQILAVDVRGFPVGVSKSVINCLVNGGGIGILQDGRGGGAHALSPVGDWVVTLSS